MVISDFPRSGYAPQDVYRRLVPSQREAWRSVRVRTKAAIGIAGSFTGKAVPRARLKHPDDLAGIEDAVRNVAGFKEEVLDRLKECPIHGNQVGAAFINDAGIKGVEIWDSPKSWRAIHETVAESYAIDLAKRQSKGLWSFDETRFRGAFKDLVSSVEFKRARRFVNGTHWATYIVPGKEVQAEFTALKDRIIHAMLMRVDELGWMRDSSLMRP